MTIEKRTKTITKDFYIAKDGTEFELKEDCLEYEVESAIKSLKMFDKKFHRTTVLNNVLYIYLETQEELDSFKECCDYYGEDDGDISDIGYNIWDDDIGKYVNIDDKIKEYKELKEEFKNYVKGA